MNLKIIMPRGRSQTKRALTIRFYLYKILELIYSDKTQISGLRRCRRERVQQVTRTYNVHDINRDDAFTGVYVCQNLSNCALKLCALHYVKYAAKIWQLN